MKQIGWIISRYLVQAIVPYFAFSWLLLTVILFVQQASRFSDIFFSSNLPGSLVWQLSIALIPNVIAFTCPMAVLVGTIIGLSKMRGDSELVAIRAAGVGNFQITLPVIILGILLSAFAFTVNLKGVPFAARMVRNVALESAIKKLESPIEPGVFNTEIAGYTIYVKGGDIETGHWNNIFIYNEDAANDSVRLITSKQGRIDTTDQFSEMVLENSTVTTIPRVQGAGKYVTENVGDIRLAIKTKRSELLNKLSSQQGTPEELGLSELSDFANSSEGSDRIEAQVLLQRRLLLSVSPLIFCLLGVTMTLRFNRGGRGFGIFLSLVALIGYYLLTFLGEQMARTGRIPPIVGGLMPIVASGLAIIWIAVSPRISFFGAIGDRISSLFRTAEASDDQRASKSSYFTLTSAIRDIDLAANLLKYFFLALGFLTAVFTIFTAFELWRFAGVIPGGTWLLLKYLIFLMPFVYLQIAPSAAMIATLATYVIKSRQNEIVTWTAAGQSIYSLLVPGFVLMIMLGFVSFGLQESIAPTANRLQDDYRTQIRKSGTAANVSGRYWVANENRLYSFEIDKPGAVRKTASLEGIVPDMFGGGMQAGPGTTKDQAKYLSASDNEKREAGRCIGLQGSGPAGGCSETVWQANETDASIAGQDVRPAGGGSLDRRRPGPLFMLYNPSAAEIISASDNETRGDCASGCVKNLTVYEFANNGSTLQFVYRAPSAVWSDGKIVFRGNAEKSTVLDGHIATETIANGEVSENSNPFLDLGGKPSHMSIPEIRRAIRSSDSDLSRRSFAVALEKRYSTLFLPFVIALFTAPFALSMHRSGRVVTVGYAIGLWLVYTGTTYLFEEFGINGFLSPTFAVFSPVVIFSMLGVYLLSKIKT